MSRETEKVFKELHKFLDAQGGEDLTEEELNARINSFMTNYNNSLLNQEELTEKTAKTADDFLELAEMAETDAEELRFARKALKLDPMCFDAEIIVILGTSNDSIDAVKKLKRAVNKATKLMEAQGYMEDVGHFWGITATRPYMRLRREYLESLLNNGMYKLAVAEAEELIRLSDGDNLGVRYILMHLYAFLEMEAEAKKLYKHYDGEEISMMLMPLAILMYKKQDFIKAEEYLKTIQRHNKDLKKFFKAIENGTLDKHVKEMNDFGYQPFTIQELIVELMENQYLFEANSGFVMWASHILLK